MKKFKVELVVDPQALVALTEAIKSIKGAELLSLDVTEELTQVELPCEGKGGRKTLEEVMMENIPAGYFSSKMARFIAKNNGFEEGSAYFCLSSLVKKRYIKRIKQGKYIAVSE